MASLPGPPPRGAEYVRRGGKGWEAKMPGMNEHLPLSSPGVHLDTTTQFDPGGGAPMVNLHAAHHGNALPASLVAAIKAIVEGVLHQMNIHEYAGSPAAMPGSEPPPPPASALGAASGLPGPPPPTAMAG